MSPSTDNAKKPEARDPKYRVAAVIAVWAAAVTCGLGLVFVHADTPAQAAVAADRRPEPVAATPSDRPALTIFLHPQCPCSVASLDALAGLLATHPGRCEATAVFADVTDGDEPVEKSALWGRAAAIPGLRVRRDDAGGATAARYGARASGQTFVYAADGRLAFSGGLTPGRGMAGDSAGQRAIAAILEGDVPAAGAAPAAPVFGCSLR